MCVAGRVGVPPIVACPVQACTCCMREGKRMREWARWAREAAVTYHVNVRGQPGVFIEHFFSPPFISTSSLEFGRQNRIWGRG